MGKTLMGSTKVKGQAELLNPQQRQLHQQFLGGLGPQALDAFQQFLGPTSPEDLQDVFQQAYVEPALQTYEQQILPQIQQNFADIGAGSSSALNQALAQSAGNLSTALGSQFGQLYQTAQGQQQNALQQFLSLMTGQVQQPIIQQQQGLAGPLIGGLGQLGAGYLYGR